MTVKKTVDLVDNIVGCSVDLDNIVEWKVDLDIEADTLFFWLHDDGFFVLHDDGFKVIL